MARLRLTKHHALGNDFLVLVDADGRHPIDAELARRLCDRHRGVGADGLLRAGPADGADVAMEVRNADGGEAETSGNGLRCLAQAVVDAGMATGPHLSVVTAAGLRHLTLRPGREAGAAVVEVDMGPAIMGADQAPEPPGERAKAVDMGNPHLVVLGPHPEDMDLTAFALKVGAGVGGGANLELVAVGPGDDELTMRVWERGVGETLACGTGACAAAAAAHQWGLVGAHVVVHQPGGAAQVDLHADTVILTGPAQHVARVEVDV